MCSWVDFFDTYLHQRFQNCHILRWRVHQIQVNILFCWMFILKTSIILHHRSALIFLACGYLGILKRALPVYNRAKNRVVAWNKIRSLRNATSVEIGRWNDVCPFCFLVRIKTMFYHTMRLIFSRLFQVEPKWLPATIFTTLSALCVSWTIGKKSVSCVEVICLLMLERFVVNWFYRAKFEI